MCIKAQGHKDFSIIVMASRNICDDLIRAVIYGQLGAASELINLYGLSYSPEWSEGYSLLFEAVKAGNVEIVELLLSNNCQVNIKTPAPDKTALHVAVNKGKVKIVEMLLVKGADVTARDKNGKSPLHYAIHMLYLNTRSETKKEYIEIIELLIEHKAEVNDCIRGEEMPLHVTVKNADAETTEILLRGKAKADVRNKCGETPLYLATEMGDEKLVKLLLDKGAATVDFKYNGKTVLHIAFENVINAAGYPEIIEHLLQSSRDENNNKDEITKSLNVFIREMKNLKLSMSSSKYQVNIDRIRSDYKEILNKLLKCGYTIDSKNDNDDYFLSRIAAATGCRTVVDDLLSYGLDINKSCMLHIAADRGEAEMVQFLINSEADPNHCDNVGKIPIFYAIRNNKVDIVNILLNSTEIAGDAELLNAAVSMANPAIVKIALNHIYINTPDGEGVTALHCTALDKNYIFEGFFEKCPNLDTDIEVTVEIAELILNRGGAVDARCRFGRTPLSVAAENGRSKLVECLLNFNADCNSADDNGNTAVHYAVRNNHLDVVKVLLKFGANVDMRNVAGETALHLAAAEVNVQIFKTLLNNGASIDAGTCEGSLSVTDYAERSRKNLYSGGLGINGLWNEYRNNKVSCYREIIDVIEQHILKMIALNQRVIEKHLQWIGDYTASEKLNNFYQKCVSEIEKMKDAKIGDSTINFYTICVHNENELVKDARNNDLVRIMKLRTYENVFPIYSALIESNFKKGQRRNDLIISGIDAFYNLFGCTLPKELIDDMFSLLSNIDVKNFIKASNANSREFGRSGFGVAKKSEEISLMFCQNMLSIIEQIRPSVNRE